VVAEIKDSITLNSKPCPTCKLSWTTSHPHNQLLLNVSHVFLVFQGDHFSNSFHIKILHFFLSTLHAWPNIFALSSLTCEYQVNSVNNEFPYWSRMSCCADGWTLADVLKHWYICTSCHNVTSWKTWISNNSTWHSESLASSSLCNVFNFPYV